MFDEVWMSCWGRGHCGTSFWTWKIRENFCITLENEISIVNASKHLIDFAQYLIAFNAFSSSWEFATIIIMIDNPALTIVYTDVLTAKATRFVPRTNSIELKCTSIACRAVQSERPSKLIGSIWRYQASANGNQRNKVKRVLESFSPASFESFFSSSPTKLHISSLSSLSLSRASTLHSERRGYSNYQVIMLLKHLYTISCRHEESQAPAAAAAAWGFLRDNVCEELKKTMTQESFYSIQSCMIRVSQRTRLNGWNDASEKTGTENCDAM